jgi:hypothetical protein
VALTQLTEQRMQRGQFVVAFEQVDGHMNLSAVEVC